MNIKISTFPVIVFLVLIHQTCLGQTQVFTSGTEGYKSFRIPALVRTGNGDILAFAEGRVGGGADFGDIDIVMKRSKDGGNTWSKIAIVADYKTLQVGNPAPVLDVTDPSFPKGKLYLFYNTGNNHENEVRKGNGLREVWYKTSVDEGLSWSQPTNITIQVHRPNKPDIDPAYAFVEDWRSYANTPGHAMQILSGRFKGRIYIPANHSSGEPQKDFSDYQAHGFYSDDHGKTFKISTNIHIKGSNESTATEISGGRLMFNSRNQKGDIRQRIVSVSTDGGATWDTTYFDKNLPDPVCEGSILTIGKYKNHNILAFCNAADASQRDNLSLRISFDDGKSWKKTYSVDKSANGEKDYTAYSDIVQTGKKTIGVLYEKNDYQSIVFKNIDWKR